MNTVVGVSPSIIEGQEAPIYKLSESNPFHSSYGPLPRGWVVFSIFGCSLKGNCEILVRLETEGDKVTKQFTITGKWDRLFVPLRTDHGTPTITIDIWPANGEEREVALDVPQLEQGRRPTSPITPHSSLPNFPPDASEPATRQADNIFYDYAKVPQSVDDLVWTIVIGFCVEWNSDEFEGIEFQPIVTLASAHSGSLRIGFAGPAGTLAVLHDETGNVENTPVKISSGDNAIAIIRNFDHVYVYLNESLGPVFALPKDFFRNKLLLGGGSRAIQFMRLIDLPRSLSYDEIILKYLIMLPRFLEVYQKLIESERDLYSSFRRILSEDKFVQECITDVIWCLRRLRDYGIPHHENEIRDKMSLLLEMPQRQPFRELHTASGRTDIAFVRSIPGNMVETFRVELKNRGATGYRELPNQPIKYMSVSEAVGALVVFFDGIPPVDEIREILSSAAGLEFLGIQEVLYADIQCRQFVSRHRRVGGGEYIIYTILFPRD